MVTCASSKQGIRVFDPVTCSSSGTPVSSMGVNSGRGLLKKVDCDDQGGLVLAGRAGRKMANFTNPCL